MMNSRGLVEKMKEREKRFPVKLLGSVAPGVFVFLPMLWISGYPPEEWPFVAGVFVLALWLASLVVGGMALVAVKLLQRYAVAVAVRAGVDISEPQDEGIGMLSVRLGSILVTVVLIGLASWGLGLYALGVVVNYMGMPQLGDRFPLLPVTLFAVGGLGFVVIIAVMAWFFRTMDRDPAKIRRFSRQFRKQLTLVAEMGRKVESPVGLASGVRRALG